MCIGGPHRGLPYAHHPQRGWLKKKNNICYFGQNYLNFKLNVRLKVDFGVVKRKGVRKGDPITSYLCSGGLIRGAYHNILKFNYNLYSCLDVYQKRCVLYKLLISLRCMNESPTVAACVSTGSRRCVYKSFSLSRFYCFC